MATQRTIHSAYPTALEQANSLVRIGRIEQALRILDDTLKDSEVFDAAHALLLKILLSRGERTEALAALNKTQPLKTTGADAIDAVAFFARELEQHDLSYAMYKMAAEAAPEDARHWYNLATSARSLGYGDKALAACEKAIALSESMYPAILLRSEITTATPDNNHTDDLRHRLAKNVEERGQMLLSYALGKESHEIGAYGDAFRSFERGTAIRRKHLDYDVATDEHKMDRIIEVFDKPISEVGEVGDSKYDRHIFIIGLPRSGTTLTERILSGIEGVRSNGETNNFSTALMKHAPKSGGDVFERCNRAAPESVAREYDRLAAFDGFEETIIEKLPFNYLYAGLLARTFENSPIVWVRRHPVDSCFAMYRTMFNAAYPFTYSFSDLARYYAAYDRLMKHWMSTLPDRLTVVDYEDLVSSPLETARQLTERCGLTWSDDALDIERNRAASLTASASQVRQPIHARSSGIWKKYGASLQPLVDELRNFGVDLQGL